MPDTGAVDAVRANWVANIAGLQRFVGGLLDADLERRVEQRVHRYLDGRSPLFERRIAEGRLRDGSDVLAAVALLALDLERRGKPGLGGRFLAHYREFSAESYPESLAHHYIAYHAHVRAGVACLRHEEGDPTSAEEASRLLHIAFAHAERARVTLTLVGGLPGTGKSTLATALGDALGSAVLRSGVVRREPPDVVEREPTYEELLTRAERLLGLGESVVLVATWTDPRWRARAAQLATSTASDLVELECRVPREVARIEARNATSWPTAVGVDTTRDRPAELVTALRAVGESAPEHAGTLR